MKTLKVSPEIIQEAHNIADGIYAPLEGFLKEQDLVSVLENMRLSDGRIWPMPIVADIGADQKEEIISEKNVILSDGQSEIVLEDIEIYPFNKESFNRKLFGTPDPEHPGAKRVFQMKDYLLGGKVVVKSIDSANHKHRLTPEESREIFKKYGWQNVVAFQTRNPPHRSHEHLQKEALSKVDGLLINPVIGPKKEGDFKDEHILESYRILIEKYYPENSAVFGTFHTFMRYAGPKEALFHALVRKNFGCTHMIIGRDHAGAGNYYPPYAAQEIFDNFSPIELGIEIFKFNDVSYCDDCREMKGEGECDHTEGRIKISGTELRRRFNEDEEVSDKFMRPEVIEYLRNNKEDLFVK